MKKLLLIILPVIALFVSSAGAMQIDSHTQPNSPLSTVLAEMPDIEAIRQNPKLIRVLKVAATLDNAQAQCELGHCYECGIGVDKDYKKAVTWFRKAAAQGYVKAQFNLGMYYYHGCGVNQDYTEAAKWYLKAAEQGDAEAQCNLGVCYFDGNGVKQDYSEAVEWYRKAADQGDAIAQCNLGCCYQHGYGVEKSMDKARTLFDKANKNPGKASIGIVQQRWLEQLSNLPDCPICMDTMLFEKYSELSILDCCGKIYHRACLIPWQEDHHTCPNCRHQNPGVCRL